MLRSPRHYRNKLGSGRTIITYLAKTTIRGHLTVTVLYSLAQGGCITLSLSRVHEYVVGEVFVDSERGNATSIPTGALVDM